MPPKKQPQRLTKNFYEKTFWEQEKLVCGIDEVGRGCLGGPLVTAAVILPIRKISPLLKDSKVLSEAERLKAYQWITKHAWYGFGFTHNRTIDNVNIWQATLIAMKKALLHACVQSPSKPSAVLVDAMPLKLFDTSLKDTPVYFFPKGEQKSSSIAAASIIAKVKRDQMMNTFNNMFPGYALDEHKGYSTKQHMQAVQTNGYSIVHRMSFLSKIIEPEAFGTHRIGEGTARQHARELQGELHASTSETQQSIF